MGRAIVRDPQVFLFDEPLSNLDAKLRVQMRLEIRRLHNRLNATSIFVTHDQVEAMTLADQVVVMSAGRIEQVGAPLDIYRRPATRFVADFIGAPPMNLLKGVVGDDGRSVVSSGHRFSLGTIGAPLDAGRSVEIGVRPEDVRIGAPSSDTTHELTVDLVEELGPNRILYGRIGDMPFAVVANAAIASDVGMVPLAILPETMHVYDAETGLRLN